MARTYATKVIYLNMSSGNLISGGGTTPRIKESYSYGVICWNWTRENHWQICLVQRRLTYAYNEFISGNYQMKDLIALLNRMTVDERVIIKSLNFGYIWFHAFQYDPNNTATKMAHKNNYNNCEKIFHRNFILKGNGKNLINAIEKTRYNNITRNWSLPKGHKINENECDLEAAIREFREETQIPISDIRLIPNCLTNYSFIGDNGVKYKYIYYNAIYLGKGGSSNPTIRDCIEVIGFSWIPLNKISLIAPELEPFLLRANHYIRRHYRCNYGGQFKSAAKKNSRRNARP